MDWNAVWEFICKWWLEFVLGGVGVGLTAIARHYYLINKQYKAQQDQERKQAFKEELTGEVKELIKEVRKSVHEEIEQESTQMRDEIAEYETNDGQRLADLESRASILEDTLNAFAAQQDILKEGMLSIQGHTFRGKCRKLLTQEYIDPDDYEQLEADHFAYNKLGGNHKGDSLFSQVKTKYYAQLQK